VGVLATQITYLCPSVRPSVWHTLRRSVERLKSSSRNQRCIVAYGIELGLAKTILKIPTGSPSRAAPMLGSEEVAQLSQWNRATP